VRAPELFRSRLYRQRRCGSSGLVGVAQADFARPIAGGRQNGVVALRMSAIAISNSHS
jgi:hypothetical protein